MYITLLTCILYHDRFIAFSDTESNKYKTSNEKHFCWHSGERKKKQRIKSWHEQSTLVKWGQISEEKQNGASACCSFSNSFKKNKDWRPGCEFFTEVQAVVYFIALWKMEGFSWFQKCPTALFATVQYYWVCCSEVYCGCAIHCKSSSCCVGGLKKKCNSSGF